MQVSLSNKWTVKTSLKGDNWICNTQKMKSSFILSSPTQHVGDFQLIPEHFIKNVLPNYLETEDIAQWSAVSHTFRSCKHSPLPLLRIFEKTRDMSGVIQILSLFGSVDSRIAKNGCRIVAYIAYFNRLHDGIDANEFSYKGGYVAIIQALNAFGEIHEKVAEYGFLALNKVHIELCDHTKFDHMGGYMTISKTLQAFGNVNGAVANKGCKLISRLIFHDIARKKFGQVGACTAIIQALNAFGNTNEDVAFNGLDAVVALCRYYPNTEEFGRVGACATIMKVLESFGKTDESIAEEGCLSVEFLCRKNENNKQTFIALNVRTVIEKCVENSLKRSVLSLF